MERPDYIVLAAIVNSCRRDGRGMAMRLVSPAGLSSQPFDLLYGLWLAASAARWSRRWSDVDVCITRKTSLSDRSDTQLSRACTIIHLVSSAFYAIVCGTRPWACQTGIAPGAGLRRATVFTSDLLCSLKGVTCRRVSLCTRSGRHKIQRPSPPSI